MGKNNHEILKGDIYYANLDPVLYSEQGGTRPVLVVQNNFGNKNAPTTIICPITKQLNKANLPTHIRLCKNQFTFLEKDSIILTEQVRTIDRHRLRDYIGKVDDFTMMTVENALSIGFGMFY
ncbi:type II toxin-antitoxin system PemK/MazF family toxin [Paraclostridium bifermentans]